MRDLITSNEMEMIEIWCSICAGESSLNEKNLAAWEQAKSVRLFDMFKGKLIHEKEVEFTRHTEDFVNEFYYEREDIKKAYYDWKRNLEKLYPKNVRFWEFGTESYTIEGLADKLATPHNLLRGFTDSDYKYYDKGGKQVKLQQGSKTVRALRRLLQDRYPTVVDEFDKLTQLMSQITQNRVTKGTLCLSIHPLDYITMSDNDCNWNSCMSWYDNGEYCAGTLGCMNSTDTIVAYLKSDKDMIEKRSGGDFVWNNKKWRQLVLIGEGGVVPNLQYPFLNEDLGKAVMDWVKEISQYNFKEEGIEYDSYDMNIDYGVMYNDLGRGCGQWFKRADVDDHSFELSGSAYCLGCGDPLEYNNTMLCSHCGDYYEDEDYDDEWDD